MSEFWLGERSGELGINDYDGSPHLCRVTAWREEGPSRVAIVELEPPIRFSETILVATAEIQPLRQSDDMTAPGPTPVTVVGLDKQGVHTVRLKPGWVAETLDNLPLIPDDRFHQTVGAAREWLKAGKPSDLKLERWSHVVADSYRRGTLPASQAGLLSEVEGWDWGMPRWEHVLQGFVDREGHARVPVDHLEGEFRLGMWVAVTKDQHDELPSSLGEWLESLPGWSWD